MPLTEVCACKECHCEIEIGKAVQRGNAYYCSPQCADGHQDYPGCGHNHCNCH